MAVSVVSFSFSRAAQPEAQGPSSLLDDGFLYCILSPTGLQNSIRGPEGPFGRVWLSLPHLVSNVSDPQLSDFLSWLSYIIVQRPHNCPLNLWNGMFDRHQAEITVMQFRGHSLLVHQSMSVSWAFTLSHFISQIRQCDFFRLLAIGMCHFLPVHHFGNGMFGRAEGQYTTIALLNRESFQLFFPHSHSPSLAAHFLPAMNVYHICKNLYQQKQSLFHSINGDFIDRKKLSMLSIFYQPDLHRWTDEHSSFLGLTAV